MRLTPLAEKPFQPTEKRAGDKVLALHRVQVITERGGTDLLAEQDQDAADLRNAGLATLDALWLVFMVLLVAFFVGWAAIEVGL